MNAGKSFLLSTGIVALSAGWTFASPAVAVDFLTLGSGRGFNFRVVEVISPGLVKVLAQPEDVPPASQGSSQIQRRCRQEPANRTKLEPFA
jgi:hypothetical protein